MTIDYSTLALLLQVVIEDNGILLADELVDYLDTTEGRFTIIQNGGND